MAPDRLICARFAAAYSGDRSSSTGTSTARIAHVGVGIGECESQGLNDHVE